MKNLSKILSIIKKIDLNYKLYFIFFISLTFLVSLFEILGLSLILPLLDLLLIGTDSKIYEILINNQLIDLSSQTIESLTQLILIIIIFIYTIKFIVNLIWTSFVNKFSAKIQNNIASKLISIYINEDYSNFTKKNKGDFLRNLNSDVSYTVNLMLNNLNLFNEMMLIVFILGLFLFLKPVLMIYIFLFLIILFLLHTKLTKKSLQNLGSNRAFYQSEMLNKLNQIFAAVKEIKLSKLENKYISDFNYNFLKFNQKILRISFLNSLPKPTIEIVFVIFFCILIFVFSVNSSSELFISYLPDLAVLALGIIKILPSISRSLILKQNITANSKALNTVFTDLQNNFKTIENKNTLQENIMFGKEIELKNIFYRYDNKENFVLNDINLKIKKNECLGIYGRSGSGKTTLIDLISGLLKPEKGKIYIDEQALKESNLYNWQKKISYVSQNFYIFNDTIKNNIIFFDQKNFNQEKFNKAVKISQLDEVGEGFFNQIVGETGSLLSGGQNQRIAIARSIYQDKEIIIFDEPSSMLDEETKIKFLKELSYLKKDKTIIIISHDKETLEFCDKKFEIN